MQLICEPKIVHQGVDTLVLNYKCVTIDDYINFYKPVLNRLDILKKEAQKKEDFGQKFVKDDLGLGMGNFLVSSKGNQRYRFYIENQDFLVFLSTASIGSTLPHLQIHFRAKFLFKAGLKKSIDLVEKFVKKVLGNRYVRQVARVDIATDVMGVRYNKLDSLRFQTIMSQKDFVEVADIKEFGRFYRVQGFTFGSGAKLFRIYDKSTKIKRSPEEAYILDKWRYNGYDDDSIPVFRHEVQLRREALKSFFPQGVDEIKWLLKNVGSLWKYGVSLLEWVDLTNEEVIKVAEGMSSDARRQMFYRIKKDLNRYDFWSILDVWDNQYVSMPQKYYEEPKEPSLKTAEKYLKAFISATYKALGSHPSNLSQVILQINRSLYEYKGYTLHDYAVSKLADSYLKWDNTINTLGLIPDFDYSNVVNQSIGDFVSVVSRVNDPDIVKPIERVLEVVNG